MLISLVPCNHCYHRGILFPRLYGIQFGTLHSFFESRVRIYHINLYVHLYTRSFRSLLLLSNSIFSSGMKVHSDGTHNGHLIERRTLKRRGQTPSLAGGWALYHRRKLWFSTLTVNRSGWRCTLASKNASRNRLKRQACTQQRGTSRCSIGF